MSPKSGVLTQNLSLIPGSGPYWNTYYSVLQLAILPFLPNPVIGKLRSPNRGASDGVGSTTPWMESNSNKEEMAMLVLSRKRNQKIVIDGTIEIRVLETRGNTVKLGFVCPPDVAVHREEVLQRIRAATNVEGQRHAPSGLKEEGAAGSRPMSKVGE